MMVKGLIVKWKDNQGYGFVNIPKGKYRFKDAFIHISVFPEELERNVSLYKRLVIFNENDIKERPGKGLYIDSARLVEQEESSSINHLVKSKAPKAKIIVPMSPSELNKNIVNIDFRNIYDTFEYGKDIELEVKSGPKILRLTGNTSYMLLLLEDVKVHKIDTKGLDLWYSGIDDKNNLVSLYELNDQNKKWSVNVNVTHFKDNTEDSFTIYGDSNTFKFE